MSNFKSFFSGFVKSTKTQGENMVKIRIDFAFAVSYNRC